MAFDIYGRVGNGHRQVAVLEDSPLPEGYDPLDWNKWGTVDHVWPSVDAKVQQDGSGEYEVSIKLLEAS